jgi:hypothetical protein
MEKETENKPVKQSKSKPSKSKPSKPSKPVKPSKKPVKPSKSESKPSKKPSKKPSEKPSKIKPLKQPKITVDFLSKENNDLDESKYAEKLKKLLFKIKEQHIDTDNRIRFCWN